MVYVSDVFHKRKLDSKNINIKTIYLVDGKRFERNTDNSKNDNICNGIRVKKEYYLNNKLAHIETDFDSRIEYTFVENKDSNNDYTCPNCGMTGKVREFNDGCPYCGTYYNLDYSDKDLGSKKHYDRVIRSKVYRVICAIIDFIICLLLSYVYIKNTSRTFNTNDWGKIFVIASIGSVILYYLFYVLDAYVILLPIKKYKDKVNKKQIEFWKNNGYNKVSFFNNFNYEVRKHYYNKTDVIDYDVIDIDSLKKYNSKDDEFIEVDAYIRIVKYNGILIRKYKKKTFVFKHNKNDALKLNGGVNIIMCHNCGASIDVTERKCKYCDTEIKYLQEWILQ